MLTEDLRSQYKRYKADTSVFLSWLLATSQQCGYKISSGSGSIADSVRNQNFKIPSKCIPEMAKAITISGKKALQVPASIAIIARRAIKLRRSFAAGIKSQGLLRIDKDSDSKHKHFCDRLNESLETLLAQSSCSRVATASEQKNALPAVTSLSNTFQALTVEETTEDLHEGPLKIAKSETLEKEATKTVEIIDESEQLFDKLVMLHDFFIELYEVDGHIGQLWQDYRDSKLDLCTASTLTAAALAIASEKEKYIAETLNVPEKDLWEKLKCSVRETPDISPGAGDSDVSSYFRSLYLVDATLWKFWANFDPSKTTAYFGDDGSETFESAGMAKNIPKLRQMVPDVFDTAAAYPDTPYATYAYRVEQKDTFLSQILIDIAFTMNSLSANQQRTIDSRVNMLPRYSRANCFDSLTRQLTKSFIHCPSICSVFAGNLLHRIQSILGSCPGKAFEELYKYEIQVKAKFEAQNPAKSRGNFPWLEALDDLSRAEPKIQVALSHDPTLVIIKHKHSGLIEEVLENGGDGIVIPSIDPSFLLKHNPVLCGTRLLSLKHSVETSGITVANNHLSVLHTATIINVLRQTKRIDIKWPLLDRAIEFQIANMFFGTLPTTPAQALKVFMLRHGQSLAKHNGVSRKPLGGVVLRLPGREYKSKLTPLCLKVTKSSVLFKDLYENEESMLRTVYALKAEADKGRKDEKDDRHSNEGYTGNISIVSFLEDLQPFLVQNNSEISLDWTKLTQDCNKLLKYLVATGIFEAEPWKKLAKKQDAIALMELEKENVNGLCPIMQSVLDFFSQSHSLLLELAYIQHCEENGTKVVKIIEENSSRFAKEVEKWVEKNIG